MGRARRRGDRPRSAATLRVELFDQLNSGWVAFDDVRVQGYDIQKSYYLGGQRVALRYYPGTSCEAPTYLHGDHGLADEAWGARAWRPTRTVAL